MGLVRRAIRTLAGAALCALPALALAQTGPAPERVVSINLCTDQLAMMLAAPGQLKSVSSWAIDPHSSSMADTAAGYAVNRGLAEEIYLYDPDLVIAGSFSNPATLSMLRRLGVPVKVMEPAYSLDDVRARIVEMGAALHRKAAADAMLAVFDRDLAALIAAVPDARPLAALYFANGYTSGDRTLAGEIAATAGFRNAAVAAGLPMGGAFPLELLALSDPDLLIVGQRYRGASRSEAILDHPVIASLHNNRMRGGETTRDWVCGTPHVLSAIKALVALHGEEAPEASP